MLLLTCLKRLCVRRRKKRDKAKLPWVYEFQRPLPLYPAHVIHGQHVVRVVTVIVDSDKFSFIKFRD